MFSILINIQMFGICPYKKNFLFFVLANYKSIIFYSCVSLDTFEPIYLMTMHIINPLANWMLTHKTLTLSLSWIHGPVNLVSASNPLPLPPYDPSPQNSQPWSSQTTLCGSSLKECTSLLPVSSLLTHLNLMKGMFAPWHCHNCFSFYVFHSGIDSPWNHWNWRWRPVLQFCMV